MKRTETLIHKSIQEPDSCVFTTSITGVSASKLDADVTQKFSKSVAR